MSPFRALSSLPGIWKSVAIICAIFMSGISMGLAATGWQKIPSRVAALEVAAEEIRDEHQKVHVELRAMRVLIQQQLCLSVAEKERTPWQRCVSTTVTRPNDGVEHE